MEEQGRMKQGPAQEKPRPLKSFEEKMEGVWTLQCVGYSLEFYMFCNIKGERAPQVTDTGAVLVNQ